MVRVIAASVLFVGLVLGALIYFDARDQVLALFAWLEAQGAWGPVLFVLIMMLAVVFLVPGFVLTTGAGFMFGVVAGSAYVVIGTTLGATIAYLVARYCFGEVAARFVLRRAKLRLIADEVTPQGWKIVLLTRLVPFFPFRLSNYVFGLARFPPLGFVGGTFVGIIPFSVHNAYLGSIAADIATLGTRNGDRTPLEWGLYLAGLVATVTVVVYLNRLARRALSKYTDEGDRGEKSVS